MGTNASDRRKSLIMGLKALDLTGFQRIMGPVVREDQQKNFFKILEDENAAYTPLLVDLVAQKILRTEGPDWKALKTLKKSIHSLPPKVASQCSLVRPAESTENHLEEIRVVLESFLALCPKDISSSHTEVRESLEGLLSLLANGRDGKATYPDRVLVASQKLQRFHQRWVEFLSSSTAKQLDLSMTGVTSDEHVPFSSVEEGEGTDASSGWLSVLGPGVTALLQQAMAHSMREHPSDDSEALVLASLPAGRDGARVFHRADWLKLHREQALLRLWERVFGGASGLQQAVVQDDREAEAVSESTAVVDVEDGRSEVDVVASPKADDVPTHKAFLDAYESGDPDNMATKALKDLFDTCGIKREGNTLCLPRNDGCAATEASVPDRSDVDKQAIEVMVAQLIADAPDGHLWLSGGSPAQLRCAVEVAKRMGVVALSLGVPPVKQGAYDHAEYTRLQGEVQVWNQAVASVEVDMLKVTRDAWQQGETLGNVPLGGVLEFLGQRHQERHLSIALCMFRNAATPEEGVGLANAHLQLMGHKALDGPLDVGAWQKLSRAMATACRELRVSKQLEKGRSSVRPEAMKVPSRPAPPSVGASSSRSRTSSSDSVGSEVSTLSLGSRRGR